AGNPTPFARANDEDRLLLVPRRAFRSSAWPSHRNRRRRGPGTALYTHRTPKRQRLPGRPRTSRAAGEGDRADAEAETGIERLARTVARPVAVAADRIARARRRLAADFRKRVPQI